MKWTIPLLMFVTLLITTPAANSVQLPPSVYNLINQSGICTQKGQSGNHSSSPAAAGQNTNTSGNLHSRNTSNSNSTGGPLQRTKGGNGTSRSVPLPSNSLQVNGAGSTNPSSGYKSTYDLFFQFLKIFFIIFVSMVILKVFSILDRAREPLEKEFREEDGRVIRVINGQKREVSQNLERLTGQINGLQSTKEAVERIFLNINRKLNEMEHHLNRSEEPDGVDRPIGYFKSVLSRVSSNRETRSFKAELKDLVRELRNVSTSSSFSPIERVEVDSLISSIDRLNRQNLQEFRESLSDLRERAVSKINGRINQLTRERSGLEVAYGKMSPKVDFDMNAAVRAAEKKRQLDGIESTLTYSYHPFIKKVLESKAYKYFIFLFFFLNAVSFFPLVEGFVIGKQISKFSLFTISLLTSAAVAGTLIFIEYILFPLLFYSNLLQLFGFGKIPPIHKLSRLSLPERLRFGWQVYALRFLILLSILLLTYGAYLYADAIYTLASLRLNSFF